MDPKVVFISYSAFPKNLPFVVIPIGNMTLLLEDDVDKLGYISSHVFGEATVQVLHMVTFHQGILQKTKSGGKVWSPNKFGSIEVNLVISVRMDGFKLEGG